MRMLLLNPIFLIVWEIRNAKGLSGGSGNTNTEKCLNYNLNPQSASASSFDPCNVTQVKKWLLKNSACNNECLALQTEITTAYNTYPHYKTMQYLQAKCGMVAEGNCRTDTTQFPVCWCELNNQWRIPLLNCRSGMQMMRTFINAVESTSLAKSTTQRRSGKEMGEEWEVDAVHMQRGTLSCPSEESIPKRRRTDRPRRQNTNLVRSGSGYQTPSAGPSASTSVTPPPIPQEDSTSRLDDLPEDKCLYTPVRVSGKPVRAMLDTGAAYCIIHTQYVDNNNMAHLNAEILNIGTDRGFKVLGIATIRVEISEGFSVPVTGYVADRKYEILLGTDFFVTYGIKMNIPEGKMEMFAGQARVTMSIKLLPVPNTIAMMTHTHLAGYTPLYVSVKLNGVDKRVIVDTGSSISVVNRDLVLKPIHPVAASCSFGGTNPVMFLGRAYVNLLIGSNSLTVPAFVPEFISRVSFLTGNDFNEKYVELIDYQSRSVTFRFPSPSGYNRFTTAAFVLKGQ